MIHFLSTFLRTLGIVALIVLGGCDSASCPDERFEVIETGTCAAGPRRIELVSGSCSVRIVPNPGTGLPTRGALGVDRSPLRQGDFILFSDAPDFRLCKAKRVDFHLDIACVDAQGNPVCDAILTEEP